MAPLLSFTGGVLFLHLPPGPSVLLLQGPLRAQRCWLLLLCRGGLLDTEHLETLAQPF